MKACENTASQSILYAVHADSKRLLQKAAGFLEVPKLSCNDHAGQAASVLHSDMMMMMMPSCIAFLGHAGKERRAAGGDWGGLGEDTTCWTSSLCCGVT